jgi:hypothetical protein
MFDVVLTTVAVLLRTDCQILCPWKHLVSAAVIFVMVLADQQGEHCR